MTTTQRFREFKMPDVGEGLTEAEILKWYVKPGDSVTDGQTVCEVETAKAAVELPIPFNGVVRELHYETRLLADTYLRSNGVAQTERLCMAHSVETRLPL
ncbi:biotin/lipoyl-containing protein, partial [Streptomyces sp. NPDC048845]|uniref:biotin/lipoyl-containing protein n=1 Tax=Streptomyces sp. NPDC048845 TaxID=3155390 RepID=UPI00341BECEC